MAGVSHLLSVARAPRMRVALGLALVGLLPALSGCGSYYPQTGLSGPYARATQRPYVDRHYVYRPRQESAPARMPDTTDGGVPMRQESGTTGTVASGARHRPTPVTGSREWENEQQTSARDQEQLDRTLRTICRGC